MACGQSVLDTLGVKSGGASGTGPHDSVYSREEEETEMMIGQRWGLIQDSREKDSAEVSGSLRRDALRHSREAQEFEKEMKASSNTQQKLNPFAVAAKDSGTSAAEKRKQLPGFLKVKKGETAEPEPPEKKPRAEEAASGPATGSSKSATTSAPGDGAAPLLRGLTGYASDDSSSDEEDG
mmetsp:Transcript_23503/g.54800  ORF Transcript_23503/g.54800 Transcript_23503/m.54800 type:complete len:180 (-) Transcript_23503:135-674(-)|eukprot:CAMPEP_0178413798 /NCGR_PEP_ID=MMETSP0689_2-20121128/22711_1 /TAXON_ID=160604 /ORGANISM="Amphidinium massartii, Strain CS-259" /LENGTH=179 /DNA_ID=CAMNT_0020035077 /DNA_START=99 /DNA_END=638 /DNA_ORIENTATION=+